MELKDIIKFEPIDLTHIIITIGLAIIVIFAFKNQLNTFFNSLESRPITVTMSGAETKIELDAPVKPEYLSEAVTNPQGSQADFNDWEHIVRDVTNIQGFQKLGFSELYEKLSSLNDGELAVINFDVGDQTKNYFSDAAMLKYLSVAAEKIRYLAFYERNNFVAAISIEDVISGLASKSYAFEDFGNKLKYGNWHQFLNLINKDIGFIEPPTVKELHSRLEETKRLDVPLVENSKLVGFLNYKSISDNLYKQASSAQG